jgi:hypothetical protein
VVAQTPLKVWDNRHYALLIAVNGTAVTVAVDGKTAFTHVFAARVVDGVAFGLNKGMVGFASQNSRGYFDNIALQVLPPNITLDHQESFDDGLADAFVAEQGTWIASGGAYISSPAPGTISFSRVNLSTRLQASSFLELTATLRGTGRLGFVLDRYSERDYKFVALDIATSRVLIGYHSPRGGLVIGLAVSRTLVANTNYTVRLTLKGLTLSVTVNGSFVASYAFNGVVVDGLFGLGVWSGTGVFDAFRIRTNDPFYKVGSNAAPVTSP